MALAAFAGVTRRVKLAATVIVGPLRNTPLLAKTAASIDVLSGGRMVLGVSVGAWQEDYEAAGVAYRSRGRRLAEQLAALRDAWEGEQFGPRPAREGGPLILIGGSSDQTFARVARYADGYIHGDGPPRAFARAADKAVAAWTDGGRPGRPRLWAQGYYALGGEAEREAGERYLRDYYAFTGPFANRIAEEMLATPQEVIQFVRGYKEAGCDELILYPTLSDIAQLERLVDLVGGLG